jgi:arylsulfatase A-like enzyme
MARPPFVVFRFPDPSDPEHQVMSTLLLTAAVLLSAGAGESPRPATSSMNVLLIDIEDCRADVWGCFGNTICRTPNIDRLARTGVVFDRAYCQYVCCNPSRSSFLTGLRPHTTQVLSNSDVSRDKLPPGTRSLPQLIKQRGLYAANIGKLFHSGGSFNAEDMRAFDRIEFQNRPEGWNGPGPILSFPADSAGSSAKPAPKPGEPGYDAWRRSRSDRYGPSGLTDEQENDGKYARTAVALLREFASSGQKQFFLSLGSSRPHTPLICPQKYIDMYDPKSIPLPQAPRDKDQGVPDLSVRFGRPADIWMSRTPTPDEVRATIAAYYACVTFLDTQLGLVLDALEQTGLADKTIVVFFSDHGFHLGEHGHWSKYTLFELSTRVPMIVRIPGNPANGSRCDEIVELVDFVPTLGELLEMPVPKNLEGTSFAPLIFQPSRPWKQAAFSVFGNQGQYNSVRTKQHRYTEWKYQGEVIKELYDHERDRWETVNLAGKPDLASKQAELAALLHAGWRAALPK